LKRQSEFRLPHQNGNFMPAFAGNDDCPGKSIPAGSYTAAAPYTDSGDTTGASNTISFVFLDNYWDNYDTRGPDHVYSFTITGMGTNPEIKLTSPSLTFKPHFYIL